MMSLKVAARDLGAPYVVVLLNTGDGPVVLDVPPASKTTLFFGTVVDAWQLPLTDVGPSGEDAGKGGKYLFVPPGYTVMSRRATSCFARTRRTSMSRCARPPSAAAR
jgi:Protein of unknown function (DUF1254)